MNSEADTAELLSQLRDIHLPVAPVEPPIWPALLAAGLVVAISALLLQRYLLRDRRQMITHALTELDRIENQSPADATTQVASLLKRFVITHDAQTRQLSGDDWLQCLDHFFATRYFSAGAGRIFGATLYSQREGNDVSRSDYATLRRLIRSRLWRR